MYYGGCGGEISLKFMLICTLESFEYPITKGYRGDAA
jgi:hypothetical protein